MRLSILVGAVVLLASDSCLAQLPGQSPSVAVRLMPPVDDEPDATAETKTAAKVRSAAPPMIIVNGQAIPNDETVPFRLATPGPTIPNIGFVRPLNETREVWRYYAPDAAGRFVPRVIFLPGHGAFNMVDGMPYPWTTNRSLFYRP